MKSKFNFVQLMVFSAALLWACWAAGQQVEILDAGEAGPAEPEGGGEALEQTIAKCLADLKSDSAETRRGAVLILGKYRHPAAEAAVATALADPEAAVRRAAVVSLTEEDGPPPEAAQAMLRLLGDPDVHVRRMVSSHLPELIMSLPRQLRRGPAVPEEPLGETSLPPEVAKVVRAAFEDTDGVVRKNMLAAHPFVWRYLSPDLVRKLLHEERPENRILALQAARRALKPAEFAPAVLFLADDPEAQVRQEFARAVAHLPTPDVRAALVKLTADAEPAVAGEAWLGLVYGGGASDIDRLAAFLAQEGTDRQTAARLIVALPALGEKATPLLVKFLGDTRVEYRVAALHALSMGPRSKAVPVEAMTPLLEDPSAEVRQLAANFLRANGLLDDAGLLKLAASPHPDMREFVARAARTLPNEQAQPVLAELLLDESGSVRRQAVAEFARRQAPGWQDILGQALQDDDPQVFQAAVMLIMQRRPPKGAEWLEQAAARCTDADFLPVIQAGIAALRSPQPAPAPPAAAEGDAP